MIDSINTTPNTSNQITSSSTTSNQIESESFVNYLSNENSSKIDTSKKPDIKELMDFTNISFKEASSILYGVIGSNEDTRDWNKILTSSDVLKTAKEETAKMYQNDTSFTQQTNLEDEINPVTTIKDIQEGNIKFIQSSKFDEDSQSEVITNSLYLASSNGNLLRNAGETPQQILENLDAFGFSIEPLKNFVNNQQIPDDIKNLINETILYNQNTQTNSPLYSTFELLTNSLNIIDNSEDK